MLNENKSSLVSTNNGLEIGNDSSLRQETRILSKLKKNTYKIYSPSELKHCVVDWVLQKGGMV